MLTRGGICYNLKVSPYRYREYGIDYFFSSQNHLDRFLELKDKNRTETVASLEKRFRSAILLFPIYDVALYRKVETRGFYLKYGEVEFTCPEQIIYVGATRIKLSSRVLWDDSTPRSPEP